MKIKSIRPEFVANLPDSLAEGVLYICEPFNLAAHKCCCGCGEEVINPLNDAQWSVTVQGNSVSLSPSVGNWKYACRSHYWIRRGLVIAAPQMSESEIALVARLDRRDKDLYIQRINQAQPQAPSRSWLQRLLERGRALLNVFR